MAHKLPKYPTRRELHAALINGASVEQVTDAINRNNEINTIEIEPAPQSLKPEANAYAVVTEWGTFTRKSFRKYTHLVVTLASDEAHLVDLFERQARSDRKQAAEYAAASVDMRHSEGQRAIYQRWAVNHSTAAAEAPERLLARIKANREAIAQKRGDAYGWSGSLRNAQKMAQQARSRGLVVAAIVEVK